MLLIFRTCMVASPTSTNVQRCLQRQQDRLNIKTDVPQFQRGSETGLHAAYDFILRRLHIKDQGLLRPSCFDHVDRLPYHWKPFTYETAIMPNRKRPFRKKLSKLQSLRSADQRFARPPYRVDNRGEKVKPPGALLFPSEVSWHFLTG